MPEYTKEQNQAVKQGVDAFFGDAPMDLYARPVESADDLIARGLVDETGTATPRGVLFTQLQDAGMFDERGAVTPKAQIYAMPYDDSEKGVLHSNNFEAYKTRKADGVDGPESQDFSEIAGGIGEWVWDAAAGLGKRFGYEAQSVGNWSIGRGNSKELNAKLDASLAALIEGVVKHNRQLAAMTVGLAGGWINQQVGNLVDDPKADDQIWLSRQSLDRVNYQNQNIKHGKILEDTIGIANGVELVKNAKETLPKEEFDRIMKQGDATAQIIDPFMLVGGGSGAVAGRMSMFTRAGLAAEKTLAKGLALETRIAEHGAELAIAEKAGSMAANTAGLAKKMADDFTERFQLTGSEVLGQRAATAAEIAAKNQAKAAELATHSNTLQASIEAMSATRAKLAASLPEQIAIKTQQALELGKQAKSWPFERFAKIADPIGKGLIAADEGLQSVVKKFGFDKAANVVRTGIGFAGYSVGGVPGLAVGAGIVSAGPMLRSAASFARVMGKEVAQARGQISFWQRVANHSELGAANRVISHLMDTAQLGGIRRVGKGAIAPFPTFAMFEFLNEGGDFNADAFKRAAASSLVVGGSMAALGGMFAGTKARHRELALGDERNFRDAIENPIQKYRFNQMPNGMRRSVATYAAANPHLEFRFTTEGQSFHEGNTITINPRSDNPLKPLIAHEVLHHVVARNQMEDGVSVLLVGDGEKGGILRSTDGTLDAGFGLFMAEYNRRMKLAGKPTLDVKQAALEYYVDSMADHVAGMAESGELGAIAGRTEARRMIDRVVRATMSRLPIIRDLHFKLGGLMEADGKMVMGSGLLADGIRETPQARRMMREMLKSSAGRAQGQFEAMGQSKAADGGVVLEVRKGDAAMLEILGVSLFEKEQMPDGTLRNKLDKRGEPIPISAATDMQRRNIGTVAKEALDNLKASGKTFADGELNVTKDGTWEGAFLGDDVIRAIESRNILNKEQIRILKNVNHAAKRGDGGRFSVINHPATKKIGKKVRYATLAPTLRDVVPVAIIPTKDGNLTVGLMSVTQLHQNIETRIQSKRGQKLYQGNREALLADVSAVMELHRLDKSTTPHFEAKYGGSIGSEYKNFVNTVFGLMTPSMKDVNPLFEADKIGYSQNVYKTYRIDRISQATKMTGDTALPMPFHYDRVKMNLMPNGLPTLDGDGNPVVKNAGNLGENQSESTHADLRRNASSVQDGPREAGTIYPGPETSPGSIARILSPDRKPPRYNYAFQSETEIRRQSAALKQWANESGLFLSPSAEKSLLKASKEKSGGSEHEVYQFAGDEGGYVIKRTLEPGGFTGASPAQYFDRWEDFGKLFPGIKPEVIGVSDGHILIKQRFIDGEVYSDPKTLAADMDANGWDKVGPAKFKHRESSAIISDARPDNVIKDRDGKPWPFDVMVDDVGINSGEGNPVVRRFTPEPESVRRHAELEAKHNAGTITPEETAEAEGIVEARARAAGYDEEVFHGTAAKETFDIFRSHLPNFFTSSEEYASGYTGKGGGKGRVLRLFLKSANPLDTRSPEGRKVFNEEFLPWVREKGWQKDRFSNGAELSKGELVDFTKADLLFPFLKSLRRNGDERFDSYLVDERFGDYPPSVIPVEPSQVKSADPFTGVPLDQRFHAGNQKLSK